MAIERLLGEETVIKPETASALTPHLGMINRWKSYFPNIPVITNYVLNDMGSVLMDTTQQDMYASIFSERITRLRVKSRMTEINAIEFEPERFFGFLEFFPSYIETNLKLPTRQEIMSSIPGISSSGVEQYAKHYLDKRTAAVYEKIIQSIVNSGNSRAFN